LDIFHFDVRKETIVVMIRKDVTNCPAEASKLFNMLQYIDRPLLEVPRCSSLSEDLYKTMVVVSKISTYDFATDHRGQANFSIIEPILSSIVGRNKFPISVYSPFKFKLIHAQSYFKSFEPNIALKNIAYSNVDIKFRRYVSGAYLSASPTITGLMRLSRKIGTDNHNWNIDPDILQICLLKILTELDSLPSDSYNFPYELIDDMGYNPDSSVGFNHYAFTNIYKKRELQPYVRVHLKRIINALKENPLSVYNVIPVIVHKFVPKNEARGPDDDPDKIRIIGMMGLLGDHISKILSKATMEKWQLYPSCFIGVSVWSTLTYTTLKVLNHHCFNRIDSALRTSSVVPRHPYHTTYITMDLSGQDVSFNPLLLFITLWMRLFTSDFSNSSPLDRDLFISLFTFEMGFVNSKVVHWLDNMFYIFLGMMCSGYVMTSHGDTMSLILVTRCAIMMLLINNGYDAPFAYWDSFDIMVYGDDTIIAFDNSLAFIFGDVDGYPIHLATQFTQYGMTLKKGETMLYSPLPDHCDRFFTHIENDVIVSSGIHFLQRYFVKYDAQLNALHPDSEFCYIFPWRKTETLIVKSAIDPKNWSSCDDRVFGAAYAKVFGLMMDAGPNWTAHKYLRSLMRVYLDIDFDADFIAQSYHSKGVFADVIKKLGEFNPTLITQLRHMSDEDSYKTVLNHMMISSLSFSYKDPVLTVSDYRAYLKPSVAPKFYASYVGPSSAYCVSKTI